jgi:hypothetical protein
MFALFGLGSEMQKFVVFDSRLPLACAGATTKKYISRASSRPLLFFSSFFFSSLWYVQTALQYLQYPIVC